MSTLITILNRGDLCALFSMTLLICVTAHFVSSNFVGTTGLRYGLGGVVAVAFATQSWIVLRPTSAEKLLELVVRSLMVGACAVGLGGMLILAIVELYRCTFGAAHHGLKHWTGDARAAAASRRQLRQHNETRRRQVEQQRVQRRQEREHQRQQAEEKPLLEAKRKLSQRREDLRVELELLYALHAPVLGEAFPRATLDTFIDRFLGGEHSAETIENRADQVKRTLLAHVERVRPTPKFQTLAEVEAWRRDQLVQIGSLPDGVMKEYLVSQLSRRADALIMQLFGEKS